MTLLNKLLPFIITSDRGPDIDHDFQLQIIQITKELLVVLLTRDRDFIQNF